MADGRTRGPDGVEVKLAAEPHDRRSVVPSDFDG